MDAAQQQRKSPIPAAIGIHEGPNASIAIVRERQIAYAAPLTGSALENALRLDAKIACHQPPGSRIAAWKAERRRLRELRSPPLAVDTHRAHAAAAYYTAPWREKTLVAAYNKSGARAYIAQEGTLTEIARISEFDSAARFYSRVARGLGVSETSLMHLSAYAAPTDLFGGLFQPARNRRVGVTKILRSNRFDALAASAQRTLEEVLTQWIRRLIAETGIRKIACSGDAFANPRALLAILEIPRVESLHVPPSCGIEITSVGAACEICAPDPPTTCCWGDSISDDDAEAAIRSLIHPGVLTCTLVRDIERVTAEKLAQGEVVARVRGPAEFGSNPFGNRSVLCSAASVDAIRARLHHFDFWAPMPVSVLAHRAQDYFEPPFSAGTAARAKPARRKALAAAIHPADFVACPHVIDEQQNAGYYRLLIEYEDLTGESALGCVRFGGVYTARDAVEAFLKSSLDWMALGNWWIARGAGVQPGADL